MDEAQRPQGPAGADSTPTTLLTELSSALEDDAAVQRLVGRPVAVFLDYDGTLTPIVERPDLARLPEATRDALERLARVCTVGIISGRDLDDVRSMVAAERLWLAGSHGWDALTPAGERRDFEVDPPVGPALDEAEARLVQAVDGIEGAWVERKRFALAVHYRQTPEDQVAGLEQAVAEVADAVAGLHKVGGKKIFELRPEIDWDKGKALRWMLEAAGLDGDTVPVYIGDDVTDEDAYAAIHEDGLAVVVGDDERPTAAHHRLADTDEVRTFLDRVADLLSEAAS